MEFIKVVIWICQGCSMFFALCQTKPRWSLTKISKLVEVKVLNESHNTQCLGSVVPLAILTLCALNLKLFHISIGSQGASIWGETLDEDFELLCCEGYLVTVGGVRSILLPFTWHGRGGETSNATFLQNTGNFETNDISYQQSLADDFVNVIFSHKKWKICRNADLSYWG